jgi:transcription antitermination protein NusB
MGQRRKSRELALQCLYEMEEPGKDPDTVLQTTADRRGSSPDSLRYAWQLMTWVADDCASLDKEINGNLKNWKPERVSLVLRQVMRMALAEGRHAQEVPVKVIINEAVDLAKKYDSEEGGAFVNGVLERLLFRERGEGL